jgi:hypothetical protein
MIKSVLIMGIRYPIKYVDEVSAIKNPCGMFLAEQSKILIRNDLEEQFRLLTLLHECVHAAEIGLCMDMGAESERNADCLATFMYNFIRDNKALIKEIQEAK